MERRCCGSHVQVDQTAHNGLTPLMASCERGHRAVVQQLIRARADVDQAFQHMWGLYWSDWSEVCGDEGCKGQW